MLLSNSYQLSISMKIITLAASKGGVGKTTLCAALASFVGKSYRVGIIDLDPQGSLIAWWNKREAQSPELIEATTKNLAKVLGDAEASGFDYVFIDTPPGHLATIETSIKVADFVLVPCQPSPIDLEAVGDTLSLIEEHGKPFAFVLNRLISRTRIGEQAIMLLANHGRIAGMPIVQRTVFATSMVDGRTVAEVDGGKAAVEDVSNFWSYLFTNLSK